MKLTNKINKVNTGLGIYIDMNEVEYKNEKEMYKYQNKLKEMYKENGLMWSSYTGNGFTHYSYPMGNSPNGKMNRYVSKGTLEQMLENKKIQSSIPIEERLKGFSKSELEYIITQTRQNILNK